MSSVTPATTTLQTVGQTALATAETLMPVLLAAISAGKLAGAPQDALIAMAAQVIPALITSFGANSSQIGQLMAAIVTEVKADQAIYDAIAAQRGLLGAPVSLAAAPAPAAQAPAQAPAGAQAAPAPAIG